MLYQNFTDERYSFKLLLSILNSIYTDCEKAFYAEDTQEIFRMMSTRTTAETSDCHGKQKLLVYQLP